MTDEGLRQSVVRTLKRKRKKVKYLRTVLFATRRYRRRWKETGGGGLKLGCAMDSVSVMSVLVIS